MRTNILITLFALFLLGPVICSAQQSSSHQKTKITKTSNARKAHKGWKLVWADEFNGKKIDKKSWRRCRRNNADWGRHMHDMESLCEVGDGTLKLWAIKTPTELNLSQPCITGGIESIGLRSIRNGRVDVRARMDCATGFWPAIWLMPDIDIPWPKGGEIDIMEHLNYDDIFYQTVHSSHTREQREPKTENGRNFPFDKSVFNTFSVEVSPDEITFYINDQKTFSYQRLNPEPDGQYPFDDHPFYVILSAQVGGEWVGKPNINELPAKMEIDYVRFYEKR